MNILEINNLNVSYGSKQVIKNLSMNIEKNKITAVIGPSGCGKSTLLTTLNLMIAENGGSFTGEILFKGKDILSYEIDYLRRMIGIVFQKPTPFPFSIYKNLTYAPKYYGIKDKNRLNEIVENILKRVGLYDEINKNLNMLATK
ncbi:MAG: ATP-binding cassette domain-containing protein, partial [Tissierellales bacterium]